MPGLENSESKDGWNGLRGSTMYLVDSDFDTEDEQYGDDIEEIISNRVVNSVVSEDDTQMDKLYHGDDLGQEDDED